MFPVGYPLPLAEFTFVVSPMEIFFNTSCFTFRYYLRTNLKVYISNSSMITTVIDLQVDGGFDFHQGFIDLIPGNHQIIWEVQWDQSPVEVVRNYRAAIGDVRIISGQCAVYRKFLNSIIWLVPHSNMTNIKHDLSLDGKSAGTFA